MKRRVWRPVTAAVAAGVLLAACGGEPAPEVAFDDQAGPDAGEPGGDGGGPVTASAAPADGGVADAVEASSRAIWFEVLGVSQDAPGYGTIAPATDAAALAAEWERHRFDGTPPEVPFGEQVVLVYARPQNSCPDDLVEMRLDGDRLAPTWLPWPGACTDDLRPTAYAVALHRGSLPPAFTTALREHPGYDADTDLDVELPPYDGPPAPAPPEPPRQMTGAQVDAVFAGHPLRRCEELPDWRTEPSVDGPLSADPEVARVQEERAGKGLPSDEATARALMADDAADRAFGFPMTAEEFAAVMARNRLDFVEEFRAAYVPEHAASTFVYLHLDQAAGGEFVAGFTGDLDEHRRRIAEQYPDVPLRVAEAPASKAALDAAQDALLDLMRSGDLPALLHYGGTPYMEVGLLDPAREDLDAIAAVLDPSAACVSVTLSGLPAGD